LFHRLLELFVAQPAMLYTKGCGYKPDYKTNKRELITQNTSVCAVENNFSARQDGWFY